MSSYNWKQFTKRIPIKAPPKAIYDAWTTQQGLESWFLRLAQFTKADGTLRSKNSHVEAGDTYKWIWFGYEDSVVEVQKIIMANGWDKLQSVNWCNKCQWKMKRNSNISLLNVVKAGHFI